MIPPQIAVLPTHDGVPVSYTVGYSEERCSIAPEEHLPGNPPALFATCDGEPVLTRTNVSRQREAVCCDLCQVCARVVDSHWLADLRIGGQALRGPDNHSLPLIVDGWTCASCLAWSLNHCPALLRRGDGLSILSVRDWFLVPTPERPLHVRMPYGPVGYVKIAALKFDRFSREQFLA